MSISTPRGLRIRLAFSYSVALIARLYPSVRADAFFRTVEGLQSFPPAAGFVVGIVALATAAPAARLASVVVVAEVASFLAIVAGLHRVRVIAEAGSAYRQAAWFAVPPAAALVVGLAFSGWRGTVAYFGARLLAWAAAGLIDRALARVASPLPGVALLAPERNFLYTYRRYASAAGGPAGLLPDDEEFDGERWNAAFRDFVTNFPAVVETWV